MQQSCTYGSVRGASGNRRPYRDKRLLQPQMTGSKNRLKPLKIHLRGVILAKAGAVEVGLTVEKLRSLACLTRSMRALRE